MTKELKFVNKTKSAIQQGRTVLGTIVTTPTPQIVEALGWAGLDFVMIDTEHAPLSTESLEEIVRAADVSGITPLVRVLKNDAGMILRSLDIGSMGVHVPGIKSADDAQKAVAAVKYQPLGNRGLSPSHRAARYGMLPVKSYVESANECTMLVVHVECKEGVDNIEQILDVDGIDVVFIGAFDISQSLGIPGQVDHPLVTSAMDTIIRAARKRNIVLGAAAGSTENAQKIREKGVQYILLSTALRLLCDTVTNAYKEIVGIV